METALSRAHMPGMPWAWSGELMSTTDVMSGLRTVWTGGGNRDQRADCPGGCPMARAVNMRRAVRESWARAGPGRGPRGGAGLAAAVFEVTLEEGRGRWPRAEPACRL